ncbi:OLC1v1000778C1 [Oldenlandia corymbosa var. corymbosa]|uniref:OLC1v1000778C1 n=1 Tax=Oldenlandia corymbosa var. corymbosa TaxID=529605 RepID=A0AAV1D6Q5_OLDCO|nr:OLC1v1000778C1 [Oldenlandia corymbosa var. corymbosa]
MARDSEGKTVDDFASTIDSLDKVENLRSKYDLPLDLETRAPLGNERANSSPGGRITVYDRFMHLGLRFPLFPLFVEIVQHYRTPFACFTTNLITFVLGFARVCQHVKVRPRLILWRYFFQVVLASTSFQDWYIVKRRLRSGVKKMVEAYGGSPEWKPDFWFVRASKSYCLSWNLRETEGLGAIKDEWTQEDEECIEELNADVEKILKYSKVMSSSNAGSRLFGDEDPFTIVNSDEDVTITAAPQKKKKRIVKIRDRAKSKKARTDAPSKEATPPDKHGLDGLLGAADENARRPGRGPILEGDEALFEVVTLEEKARQVQGKEAEIALVQAKYDELDKKMKSFASFHISKEELHQWCVAFMYKTLSIEGMAAALEEMNLVATKCGAYPVGVAGLRRLDQERPIKAKWFKQLLIKYPKKTMHEAMVKVLTRLNLEQLPLWEALTGTLPKMSSPADIALFPGDVPTIFAKGPSEEDPIPAVPDEYMGIELEDADKATEEDVADTGHSGDSWSVHRLHLMVLLEEQSSEFPLYSMTSGILKNRADVHSIETVANLENDLLDAMRTHNVKVNQHLINEIKGLCEEMQRRETQSLKGYSDSLTFEAKIHDELVTVEKENAWLRARQQITVSPWFLEKHQVLARVQPMILTRTRRFITAMDILKEKAREIELLTDYIAKLQTLLLDNNIDFETFEHPEEIVDPRTRSSREELLMRVHAQDLKIVDLKDKLNQCMKYTDGCEVQPDVDLYSAFLGRM